MVYFMTYRSRKVSIYSYFGLWTQGHRALLSVVAEVIAVGELGLYFGHRQSRIRVCESKDGLDCTPKDCSGLKVIRIFV